MTHDELAREFMKLNNLDTFPTFFSAGDILEVMMKRKDWKEFLTGYNIMMLTKYRNMGGVCGYMPREWIALDYITEPQKLLTIAVEWCKEHKP